MDPSTTRNGRTHDETLYIERGFFAQAKKRADGEVRQCFPKTR